MPLLRRVILPCEVCLSTVASSRRWLAKPKCKSKVWKHFGFPANAHGEIMDKKKDQMSIVQGNHSILGNTSNLTYHLQQAHSQELVELREDSGDKPGLSVLPTAKQPSSKQQSLPGIVERSIAFPQDSAKHKQWIDATADFICQGLLPLRVVDESSFRRLLEIAEPSLLTAHSCITVVVPLLLHCNFTFDLLILYHDM